MYQVQMFERRLEIVRTNIDNIKVEVIIKEKRKRSDA